MSEIITPTPLPTIPSVQEIERVPNPKFPKSVIFILVYTLGERFSFYGLQVILTLYLVQQIKLTLSTAKIVYHAFGILTSFLPIIGGIISDVYLGKFWTILIFSLVYASGFIVLTLSSVELFYMNPRIVFICISLCLMAIGSSGFKSNLIVLGGDQFVIGSEKYRNYYFSLNFWLINLVALISFVIAPLSRAEISCFGDRFCYPLPFASATAVIITAIVVFSIGKSFYTVVPPLRTLLKELLACSWHAYRRRAKATESRVNWLDHADDAYNLQFIEDVKCVFRLLVVFLTMPIFWALFDQRGSSWTYQASLMDGRLTDDIEIQPEIMICLNPLLIIILLPFFDFVFYPYLNANNFLTKPLQKMCVGGFITAAAFLICGTLQVLLEKNLPFMPSDGHIDLMVISGIQRCTITVGVRENHADLQEYDGYVFQEVKIAGDLFITVDPTDECSYKSSFQEIWVNATAKTYTLLVWYSADDNMTLNSILAQQIRARDPQGKTFIRFIFMDELPYPGAILLLKQGNNRQKYVFRNNFTQFMAVWPLTPCEICWSEDGNCKDKGVFEKFQVYKGGTFEILLLYNNNSKVGQTRFLQIVPEDQIHILFQVPQYFFLTIGEVMFSLTGIKFLYSQAPSTMKSVMQSLFFLAIATGNLIVVIVEQVKLLVNITAEFILFFVFCGIMVSNTFVLYIISSNYHYKHTEEEL